ncbi:hypothetical protein [Pontibacillus litoralis]|uniref:Uncharacterized protein n=1 Tax=Pontibacillus litoralis JSM 072002 TaxID=1385512 RepID=A0A0A5FZ87_9BACI|nr:hypothetical protein [Pontibacillus litoralis]KGX84135.1 hypothetical protein N784_14590 [Pontibacillus litoralis JSM 072002]
MSFYQARISITTARLMEQVKRIYENKKGVSITRADVLMSAYEDSLWVKNWSDDVINTKERIRIEKVDINPSAQKLKLNISQEVIEGIKRLKEEIPLQINSRSVTYGVVIEYILRAAYIKNTSRIIEGAVNKSGERKIKEVFIKYNDIVSQDIENGETIDVLSILKSIEKDILKEI